MGWMRGSGKCGMSELGDRMNLIKTTLAAALSARIVTRDMMDFSGRKHSDLQAGIYTLVSSGESGYQNLLSRKAMDGGQKILLVGQFVLAEDATTSAIEEAEFVMVDEIKGFLRALPAALCQLQMTDFRQSGQMEHPRGWVAIDLEFIR